MTLESLPSVYCPLYCSYCETENLTDKLKIIDVSYAARVTTCATAGTGIEAGDILAWCSDACMVVFHWLDHVHAHARGHDASCCKVQIPRAWLHGTLGTQEGNPGGACVFDQEI